MIVDLGTKTFTVQDGVTVEIKPLSVRDYQVVLRYISEMGVIDGADATKIGLQQFSKPEVADLIEKYLPKYATNLTGVQIKEGDSIRNAEVEDLIKHSSFLTMSFTILFQIFSISSVTAEEEKILKK